ncbi:MAG: peroxiredoxin [Legionellales bacterium]|nr:peroxiredoxin [Legionellales bacterium]
MAIELGTKIPDFKTVSTSKIAQCSELFEKPFVIFFYPKDNTKGCTVENNDFKDRYNDFLELGIEVIGVSKDSLKSHHNFINKYDLPFPLISDEDTEICQLFDVYKEKSMYGRKYMGIERSTFLVKKGGVLDKEWRNVKIPGHVDEVFNYAKSIA